MSLVYEDVHSTEKNSHLDIIVVVLYVIAEDIHLKVFLSLIFSSFYPGWVLLLQPLSS